MKKCDQIGKGSKMKGKKKVAKKSKPKMTVAKALST